MLRISVVIAVYNAERTLKQTLESIVNQAYANLELIIVDGKSTDGTHAILKNYDNYISQFISEKDRGQYFALNKGFSLCTGDVLTWLNADDILANNSLKKINQIFSSCKKFQWVIGRRGYLVDGKLKRDVRMVYYNWAINYGLYIPSVLGFLQQEGVFFTKDLWMKAGPLNCDYSLAADYHLWSQFSKEAKLYTFDEQFAYFRISPDSRSKIGQDIYFNEIENKSFLNFNVRWLTVLLILAGPIYRVSNGSVTKKFRFYRLSGFGPKYV